jgi:hypothetical protein
MIAHDDDDDDDDDGDGDDDDDDDDDEDDDDDDNDDKCDDGMVKLILIIINVPSMGKVRPGSTVSQQGKFHLTTAAACCHYPLLFAASSD